MQVKKQQLEKDMEQGTGSIMGKEYVKAVYWHPAYLTYMQSTSCKMPGWMKHKLAIDGYLHREEQEESSTARGTFEDCQSDQGHTQRNRRHEAGRTA